MRLLLGVTQCTAAASILPHLQNGSFVTPDLSQGDCSLDDYSHITLLSRTLTALCPGLLCRIDTLSLLLSTSVAPHYHLAWNFAASLYLVPSSPHPRSRLRTASHRPGVWYQDALYLYQTVTVRHHGSDSVRTRRRKGKYHNIAKFSPTRLHHYQNMLSACHKRTTPLQSTCTQY